MRRGVKILGASLLAVSIAIAVVGFTVASRASAISALSVNEAHREVAGTDKVLVMTFCQRGCMPCQAMKVVTWKNSSIIHWMSAHAVGVQVDTDQQPAIAKQMSADATPMVIMLSDQGEIARNIGFMSADEMMTWLQDSFAKRKH